MNRFWLGFFCLAGSAVLLFVSDSFGNSIHREEVVRHLAVALIEVALTVAAIDWFLDRHQRRAEASKIALNALEEIHYAIWVWLGGKRRFDLSEMYGLLEAATDEDKPAYFTENLLMRIGAKASHTDKLRDDVTSLSQYLRDGFAALAQLAGLRDGIRPVAPTKIAELLRDGCIQLEKQLQPGIKKTHAAAVNTENLKESNVAFQFWRDRGEQPGKYDVERMNTAVSNRIPDKLGY